MSFLLLILGFFILVKGADWFVEGAVRIAKKFNIPPIVIGLTIVSFGTSAPEAAVSIAAAINGSTDIAIGNVIGSNIFNIVFIIAITSIIMPLKVKDTTIKMEIPFVILSTILLLALAMKGQLAFSDGVVFWIFFLIFIRYLFKLSKKGNKELIDMDIVEKSDELNNNLLVSILMTVLGLISVVVGSEITVNASVDIAEMIGLSKRFIGLTIVSLGTSLPELVTSITAALKKQDDIAIGNIVGSNIFNILFVLGTTSLISTIPFQMNFIGDIIISIIITVILLIFSLTGKRISRGEGATFLMMYFVYIIGWALK
ncbi:calcium/sodium antiporter [Defluviitalea phaphyphila]|uniref:calcium/sodium antiporter n=1 Tax=Defluviitalea phaphyphila TaxID=1473580 RepID=UPI0007DC387B|nr:calcium/sodium antiporter [Defluviitalea phaphyphila]